MADPSRRWWAAQITSDDVVVMYDTARYITGMMEISQLLKHQGVPMILITDMGPCPCLPYSTISIHMRSSGPGENSFAPVNAAVGVILRYLAYGHKPEVESEYANVREGVFSRFNPYGVIEPGADYTERI